MNGEDAARRADSGIARLALRVALLVKAVDELTLLKIFVSHI
jgi:hypothetical protein